MKVFWKFIKWLGIAALVAVTGVVLFFVYHLLTIKIVGFQYKYYFSDKTNVSVIASDFNLGLTNQYHLAGWSYNTYGLVDATWSTLEKKHYKMVWIYKTKGIIPSNVLDIPIEQRITNDVDLRDSFSENVVMYECSTDVRLYKFICQIKYDKKVKILSAYMNSEIMNDEKIETDKYNYRIIYANQRKLGFCEDAKDLRKGVLYFYFERRGFINTDIAIVQMKNEPQNLYFVYTFDEYAGKNHEAIRNFMKDYFDIQLKEEGYIQK